MELYTKLVRYVNKHLKIDYENNYTKKRCVITKSDYIHDIQKFKLTILNRHIPFLIDASQYIKVIRLHYIDKLSLESFYDDFIKIYDIYLEFYSIYMYNLLVTDYFEHIISNYPDFNNYIYIKVGDKIFKRRLKYIMLITNNGKDIEKNLVNIIGINKGNYNDKCKSII